MCYVKTLLLPVICLSFIIESNAFGFDFEDRVKRQASNCSKPNFACSSGQCIDGDKECDGAVDCDDASDETTACSRLKCPPYLFTCKYGACINKDLECDGRPDCRDKSDENTPSCRSKDDDSPKCKANEFRCGTGQCIDQDFKCDGKAECDDHTDEVKATCWNVRCPGFTYRCSYGACVNGNAECNGIVECFDGSDENPAVCGTNVTVTPGPVTPPPIAEPGSCFLPQHPKFGHWTIPAGNSFNFQPGTIVRGGTLLKVICDKQFKLDGSNLLFCENGAWSSDVPKCSKTCPARISTATMTVNCIYKNTQTENCTDAVDGTLASFKCAPFYEDLNLKRHPVHICKDGTWDHPHPACVPVCGQKTVDATELIIGGKNVTKGEYPWQAAIYKTQKGKSELICGGSLLNQRMILTAAHCVTDPDSAELLSMENYVIAVGKYYRSFNDTRDRNDAQFSRLKKMIIPPEYRGAIQNYLGDIAILVTEKTFVLSRRVQPVCLDSGQSYSYTNNEFGYVTGWGFTVENNKPSEVLKELRIPAVSYSTCRQNLPEDYERYLTSDKLCAGYLDKSSSVCKGDSGGGLVFKYDGRYYITAIVSLSPTSPTAVDGCDKQQYGLFTKVSDYINKFILQNM